VMLWLVSVAAAAEISLNVGSKELVVGQTVPVTVRVVDGNPRGIPEIPFGEGLQLRYEGQAQQHVVVNFKSTRIVQYQFQLSATQPGEWTLGPVDMVVDGQRLGAAPITLHVGEPPKDQGGRPVIATLSNTAPFLGEVVLYRFQFKYNQPLRDAPRWAQPKFDGFVEEKVAESMNREYKIQEDSETYTVQAIEVPLVAASVGQHTVPPATLTARYRTQRRRRTGRRLGFDDLFQDSSILHGRSQNRTYSSSPIDLEIRPLPVEGRPADFAGTVGRFYASAEVSTTAVALGESVTMTYSVRGGGTLHGFRLPVAPADAGFRAYDDTPEISASVLDGRFVSEATIKRAIVPEKEGLLTIPGLRIPVFDPIAEEYTTLQTEPLTIEVSPGEDGAGEVASYAGEGGDSRRVVESVGEDILPLTTPERLFDATLVGALPVIGALPGLPLLAWLALLVNSWMDGRKVDPYAVQRKRLTHLPADPDARLAALEDIFREVAGLRLGVPAPALDADAVHALGPEAAAIYRDLEQVRYGGGEAVIDDLRRRIQSFVAAA